MSNHPMLDLVPLYALDALEPGEQREFEAHLDACSECRASLDVYQEVATSLAHDVPASDETWEQISAAISIDGSAESNVVQIPRSGADAAWIWVAGIAAAVALLLGVFVVFDSLQDSQLRGEDIVAAADRIAAEPGSIVGDFVVDDAAVAQIVLSSDGQGFVIPTDSLPALGPRRAFSSLTVAVADSNTCALSGFKRATPARHWSG